MAWMLSQAAFPQPKIHLESKRQTHLQRQTGDAWDALAFQNGARSFLEICGGSLKVRKLPLQHRKLQENSTSLPCTRLK